MTVIVKLTWLDDHDIHKLTLQQMKGRISQTHVLQFVAPKMSLMQVMISKVLSRCWQSAKASKNEDNQLIICMNVSEFLSHNQLNTIS